MSLLSYTTSGRSPSLSELFSPHDREQRRSEQAVGIATRGSPGPLSPTLPVIGRIM